MEAFLSSIVGVLIAEIGDKTQLLTLFLAARFAQKNAIICGIFVATLFNHVVSAYLGVWVTQMVSPAILQWLIGGSFIVVGLWLLIPDKNNEANGNLWLKYGAFVATFVLFFLAEIGDKTQIATVLLAAKYQDLFWVILGSILGLMLANVPVVYLGEKVMRWIPANLMRWTACVLFCALGVITLLSDDLSLVI